MIVYHYTSSKSYYEIKQTGILLHSDPWTTMDSAYGHGWYFTNRAPDKCDAWTMAHCWRRIDIFSRVEYFLKFDIPENYLIKCRDYVYMIPLSHWDGMLNNRGTIKYLEGGATQKCGKAPCFLCDMFSKVKEFFGWK